MIAAACACPLLSARIWGLARKVSRPRPGMFQPGDAGNFDTRGHREEPRPKRPCDFANCHTLFILTRLQANVVSQAAGLESQFARRGTGFV